MRFLNLVKKLWGNPKDIIIVSGLPRSGTSMMMQLLHAADIPIITDQVRKPDTSNAKGYYEHEGVKALAQQHYDCLANAQGCAIKIVSSLLKHLPKNQGYKIVFMQRNLDDVLASQQAMLKQLESESKKDHDPQLKQLYTNHLIQVKHWLTRQSYIDVLYVDYNQSVNHPQHIIHSLSRFLNITPDHTKLQNVIDKNMQHHRRA